MYIAKPFWWNYAVEEEATRIPMQTQTIIRSTSGTWHIWQGEAQGKEITQCGRLVKGKANSKITIAEATLWPKAMYSRNGQMQAMCCECKWRS